MFGERLKLLRENRGMLQSELAEHLKLAPSSISMYEKGLRDPDTDTLSKLAELFNVTTDYLLGRTDNPQEKKYKHLDNVLIGRFSSRLEKMDEDELDLLDKLIDKIMKDDK